jgi:CYTH domain-containing protein
MGTEIERKFLVIGEAWRALAKPVHYRQGYLSTAKICTVRVRKAGDRAALTVKGASIGATRSEYEYEIPPGDAEEMIDCLCERPVIEKNRYQIPIREVVWEVDEFLGANRGLVVAEIELTSEDQVFDKPEWIGEEVTGDPKYFNANLVAHPFLAWETD